MILMSLPSTQETAYWMKAFAKRAYFNSTQIFEDLAVLAGEAQILTMDTLSKTQEYMNQQCDQISKAVDPYTRPVGHLYQAHLAQHVNAAGAAARPVYDKHIAPVVAEVQSVQRQKSSELRRMLNDAFDGVMSSAKETCRAHKKQIEKTPAMIRNLLSIACDKPEETIWFFCGVIVILVLLLFRKTIFKLAWDTMRIIFRVVWYLMTFGCFRSKRPLPNLEENINPKVGGETAEETAQ